jgi:uncharacterized protein YggE
MLSLRNRYAVAVGVLIAFAAGGVTAAAFNAKTSHVSDRTAALSTSTNATIATASPAATVVAAATTAQQSTITVVGNGTATGVPTEATLGIGVQATRSTVNDAVNVAGVDMNRLLNALHQQGVLDKDIQTSSVSIYQQTNCCPQSVTGYVSSNQLTVTIHHLKNVSTVIEAAVAAVGNDIQLNGVSLFIGDPTALVKTARAAAMSDAGARAQVWAGLAHRHVGGIIALSELVSGPAPIPCNGCGKGGGGGVPIQPGQTDVTITITAVYELLA